MMAGGGVGMGLIQMKNKKLTKKNKRWKHDLLTSLQDSLHPLLSSYTFPSK